MKLDPLGQLARQKANPFYSNYRRTKNPLFKQLAQFIDREAERAKQSAENLIVFRRFQLGQRISSRAYQWVNPADIQTAPESILKDKSLRAVMSFDLALSNDFCAGMLCLFSEDTEKLYFKPFLQLANTDNRSPAQTRLFRQWHELGHITIQDRPAIDKSLFVSPIKQFLKEHGIAPEKHIWDRNLSAGFTEEFSSDPLLLRGSPAEVSHAIRYLEARAKEKKLYFIGKTRPFPGSLNAHSAALKAKAL